MTENKIDIISIKETKLDDTIRDEQVAIEGFSLLRLDRNRHGGGVAFYIRETVNYEHRIDIKTSNAELLCIEVKQKCTKPFIVMAWYRPPKYEYQTIDEIETLIKSLDAEDKEIILMGDVNCNDLDTEGKNRILVSLCNMYHTYQLKQLIKFPTRSTLSLQTLIDHFATNKSKFITESGVFATGFSDHDLVFGIRKISTRINREPKVVKTRQLKNYNPEKFRQNLEQVNWKNILKLSDVNEMSLEWEKQFISILDWHAPY